MRIRWGLIPGPDGFRHVDERIVFAARGWVATGHGDDCRGAAYVLWLSKYDVTGLALLMRDVETADPTVRRDFREAMDAGYEAIRKSHQRQVWRRRPVRAVLSERRPVCRSRGRAARPGRPRSRRAAGTRAGPSDDGGPEPEPGDVARLALAGVVR